jgi:hypothetical protein
MYCPLHLWFIPGKPEVASFNVFVPIGENRWFSPKESAISTFQGSHNVSGFIKE